MPGITFEPTAIPGVLLVHARVSGDDRGSFIKTFELETFKAAGLATNFVEEYHTTSRFGVVRGMHFQTPPHAHEKLVFCLDGAAFDVVADLRVGSPMFGKALTFDLDAESGVGVYLPIGCAHGFASVSESSTFAYRVTSAYAPANDAGVLWSSIDVEWPFKAPILSGRDQGFPALADFDSPFVFEGE